jgi:uncharacterized protein YjbI with pentapeptide repeats
MHNTTKTNPDASRTSAIIPGDFLGTGMVFSKLFVASCLLAVGCEGIVEQPEPQTQPEIQAPAATVVAAEGLTVDRMAGNGLTVNGINLNGINLNGINLNGINLNGINLNGINLNGINLNGVGLNGINLNGINLNGISLNGINLNSIKLNGINLNGVNLNGINLNGVNLNGINLNSIKLNGINLNGLNLNGLNLNGINLNGMRLNGLSLAGLNLQTAKLGGAPLTSTQMSNLKLALSYVAKCAMPSGQCVTVTDSDGVSTFSMCGESGLDPAWGTDLTTSVTNEAAVTQCVLDIADNDPAYPSNTVTHTNREAPILKDFFNHVVYCALPAATCVTATDIDGVSTYQACGSQGLDPAWQTGPATSGTVSGAVAACVTSQGAAHGDAWYDYRERFKTVIRYAAECALRADQSISVTDWNGSTLSWPGSLGLASWWVNAPLNPAPAPKTAAAGEELVSACLMARTNAFGHSVAVSLRARPELTPTTTEATKYNRHEGAFMGNLFGTTPVAKVCSASGGNWLWDANTGAALTAGRQCADGTTCGFDYVGPCTSVCNVKPGVNGETLFDECSGNSNVVNTFLFSVPTFVVDDRDTARITTGVTGSDDAPMVAAADFNNDGYTDLATENNYNSVVVRLSSAEGGFSSGVTYNLGTGIRARAIVAKDLNKDGKMDLVTANQTSLSVLLGVGDGTFAAATNISVTNAAGVSASVAVADYNNDGKLDLATNLTSGVGVFLGTGTGTFGSQASFGSTAGAHSLTAGDFNGDGKVDLASASSTAAAVYVTWGLGNGTFGTTATVSVSTNSTARPRSIATTDMNSDGKADLAVSVSVDNAVRILLGQANSTFLSTSYAIAGSGEMRQVSVTYLDGAGPRDLLVVRGQQVIFMTGSANGTFTMGTAFNVSAAGSGITASYVIAGHFDRDPLWRLDLIASTDNGNLVQMNGKDPQP